MKILFFCIVLVIYTIYRIKWEDNIKKKWLKILLDIIFVSLVIPLSFHFFTDYFGEEEQRAQAEFREKIEKEILIEPWLSVGIAEGKDKLPVVAEYFFLIFKSHSQEGLEGVFRFKGTNLTYPFTTVVYNEVPIVVQNIWKQEKGQYSGDAIFEYKITKTPNEKYQPQIFIKGWNFNGNYFLKDDGIPLKIIHLTNHST